LRRHDGPHLRRGGTEQGLQGDSGVMVVKGSDVAVSTGVVVGGTFVY
jgi:hypothetical protein